MQRRSFLLAGAGVLFTGCAHRSSAPQHFQDIASNGEPLRSAFNQDVDKVRILMLVSPT
ncbi:MAG TPA: hypothetical protein VKT72_02315 [Candidatus Baltobacteraceae bacterium]|nr:hypothetical protein [Candidatus Baltobacteraceae bacterium]